MKVIIRKYEQFYANIFNHLDELDKTLVKHKLSALASFLSG